MLNDFFKLFLNIRRLFKAFWKILEISQMFNVFPELFWMLDGFLKLSRYFWKLSECSVTFLNCLDYSENNWNIIGYMKLRYDWIGFIYCCKCGVNVCLQYYRLVVVGRSVYLNRTSVRFAQRQHEKLVWITRFIEVSRLNVMRLKYKRNSSTIFNLIRRNS